MLSFAVLPDPVRGRVISLAAHALGQMSPAHVPAALRRSATFAPAKRARLVGSQLMAALDADQEFRRHLGVQVRAISPKTAASVDAAAAYSADEDADQVERAAVACLLQSAGWVELVERAAAKTDDGHGSGHLSTSLAKRIDALSEALDRARSDLKASRDKARTRVELLKNENAQLRRTLSQARAQAKESAAGAARLSRHVADLEQELATTARAHEGEVRRLHARIAAAESARATARRAVRDDREAEVMRLRLLLDTVSDAAGGLRRELALPPSDLLPADTVVALEPAEHFPARDAGRALAADDPVLLRQLLALPRVHLIVDGYNVTKTAWPSLPLDQQRSRLTQGLGTLPNGKKVEVTVVFDGADLAHPPPVASPRGVRVRFSPPHVIADDLIRQLVEAEPTGRPLVVVSSDKEVARAVTKRGARAVAAEALVRTLGA